MASAGVVHSLSFTPMAAGLLIVTVTYDVDKPFGSDWGSTMGSRIFCTQNGVTVYGDSQVAGTARARHVDQFAFDVVGGAAASAGLYGNVSGATTANWYNITVALELKKK